MREACFINYLHNLARSTGRHILRGGLESVHVWIIFLLKENTGNWDGYLWFQCQWSVSGCS